MNSHKTYNLFLILVFGFILAWPLIENFSNLTPDIENLENRKLAEKPDFNPAKLDPFPTQFETYYNDHFPFRNYCASAYAWLDFYVFQKKYYPGHVIVGANNNLFSIEKTLNHFRGKDLLSSEELKILNKEILKRKDYLADRNIPFLVVVTPDKYTVYPEDLPGFVQKLGTSTKAD